MKYLVLAAFCTFLVIEMVAAKPPRPSRPPRPPKPQKCYTSEDCEADECCVGEPKKFFKKAECRKLEVEGDRCSEEDAHFRGRYLSRCPCVEGLTCQSKKVEAGRKDSKIRFNARCVDPNTTSEPEPETVEPEPEPETVEPEPETSASESESDESAE
ncbi:hypothetical protein AVEN_232547-1 [Araneus ventricosus]|uniref:Prokineticin domain-containing protein n=1 Tax=Araneus ventricosus TaxID=182803 RepID=A0A4Y2SAE5_ARAVE|nr:hypothetical protein AVEN_193297-1 [Araneus ventricosus]GBN85395.1 hypothetical protein AVEN_232547-1 [Araneus ventricosus]